MDINDFFKNLFDGSINISIKFVKSSIDVVSDDYELIYNDVIEDNNKIKFLLFCPNSKNLFFRIKNNFLEVFNNDIMIFRKKISKKNNKKYIRINSKLNNNTLTISLF